MKIIEIHDVLSVGRFPHSPAWHAACAQVEEAIRITDWPHGSGKFTIFPESEKKRGMGNGVVPIKKPCLERLNQLNWLTEKMPPLPVGVISPRDLDAVYRCKAGFIGLNWERRNFYYMHRAINKLLLTIQLGGLMGGLLVLPSDNLKAFLMDRIACIGELRPYFPLWSSIQMKQGALRLVVVEHDATSFEVPKIPKSTNGRAF